ncbi:MAG: DUF4388 domain-containing protein [Deltaproteobacteria bacterium]|nr:DUF4388 domain-containing protein [Deltaproteobacteria bacterium]
MSSRPRIVIDREGNLLADEDARLRLGRRAGDFELAAVLPGLVFLLEKEGPKVAMAGEILTRMTIMEIGNMIASAAWRGELHVIGEHHRAMRFDQGALRGARSNSPDDRLGEVLFRAGVLSRAQVREIAEQVGPDSRFGELCVKGGYVDAGELYKYLQKQATDVFFNALIVDEGSYVFVMGDVETDDEGTTVHLPVQSLLMEGVQRIDEMALFRDKIPHADLCPQKRPDAPDPKKLDTTATRVLELCDGRRTIDDIARETGYGEFATTKAVYHLIQQKQVDLRTPSNVDPDATRALVVQFNDVLQDIFMAVATYGGLDQTRMTLDAWIQGSGYGPYFGEGVDEFGAIDPERVVTALQDVESDHPLEALHQALHELAAFALFSATTALPRDQELTLARDVNTRLKAIRMG